MVSQWPPVFPTWSNLVQFDIQPKHPDPATLHNITRLVKTGSVLSVVKVLVWGVNEVFIRVIGANLTISAP